MIGAGQKFGKYTLLERIAEGGMAEIYKASVIGNDGREHIVALKRLHRAFCEDHELTQMLVDEARIAVQLHHPHIAQVFDLGSIDQQHFLVMEFVAGHDMHELLRFSRQKRVYLPIEAVVLTLIHVADALQYAHTRHDADGRPLQIVHRDVSPQNIMVSTRGEVKLVDFGIAKAKNRAQVTQHGIIKGKYYYMAPEQAHGHHVDGRTDIYALGMVLYEGLTGRSPFEEVPEVELLKHVRQSQFPPPSYYRPDLDPELDAIVERMTQRDPNLRYQSMAEVRQALADFGTRKLRPFGPVELARAAEELVEVRTTVEYDILQSNAYAPSESSMIFNVESGLLELHSSEFELLEEEANNLFESNPFGGTDPTIVYDDDGGGPAHQQGGFQQQPQPHHAAAAQAPRTAPQQGMVAGYSESGSGPSHRPTPGPSGPGAHGVQAQHGYAMGQQPAPHELGGDGQHPQGYNEQSFLGNDPNFTPGLAFDPRAQDQNGSSAPTVPPAVAPAQRPTQRPAQANPSVAAPDFNSGRKRAAAPPPKSLVEKLSQPPGLYALIGLVVLLVGILAAVLVTGGEVADPESTAPETTATATPEPADTTPTIDDSVVKFAVGSNPQNAKIFVDGEEVGSTPKLLELDRGAKHEIMIKRPGYATVKRQVEVGDDPDELSVQLELASGILKIQSYPPGAMITIGGREVGKTNLTETGLPLDQKLKVIAKLDDKTMEREVVWNPEEEPIQELMFEFEEPPQVDEAVAVQEDEPVRRTTRRRAPRRTTRRTTSSPKKKTESGSSLNVWGDAVEKANDSADEKESLDVWGGSKSKPKPKKEEKKPAGGLDVWGGS
jgi:serine/threonine protein kinase